VFLDEWEVIISLNLKDFSAFKVELDCHNLQLAWWWYVYCLLFADDSWSKENYKVSKSSQREIVKSQLKEEYVIENIVVGHTIIEEHTVDIIVKLNLNIK